MHLQVRVNSRDACVLEHGGQGREPALRLPLARVLAPDRFVRVAGPEVERGGCTLGNRYLGDQRAVCTSDRLVQRENRVLSGTKATSQRWGYILVTNFELTGDQSLQWGCDCRYVSESHMKSQ